MSQQRLPAPVHLSDAERDVWLMIVNDQPAGAFTAVHTPLLEMYCRHVVQARVIANEIQHFDSAWLADKEGLKRYETLLSMQEREGRAASSLATRLRITRQSVDDTVIARALVKAPTARKPWELPTPTEAESE